MQKPLAKLNIPKCIFCFTQIRLENNLLNFVMGVEDHISRNDVQMVEAPFAFSRKKKNN